MITNLRHITSLNNLGKKGQIATLLILIMVAVLTFVLVTVNIGQVSIDTTKLSNAADSAALLLGSQLATYANVYSQGFLDECGSRTSCCKKGGLAVFIGGLLGGPVGGYLAGCYQYGGSSGGRQGMTEGLRVSVTIAAGAGSGAIAGGKVGGPKGALVGAIIGAAIATYAAYRNESVKQKMTSEAFKAAARQLSGLPKYDEYRESAFYQAFIQTIDDPRDTTDVKDSDEDGNKTESVPYFQYWWERRVHALAVIVPVLKTYIEDFLKGVTNFKNAIEGYTYTYTDPCHHMGEVDESGIEQCIPGTVSVTVLGIFNHLSRQEEEGSDGSIIELARFFENRGYDLSFWSPSTTDSDEVDEVVTDLKGFITTADALKQLSTNTLVSTWQSWITSFYDLATEWTPGSEVNADWYDRLENGIKPKLEAWKTEIAEIRDGLDVCQTRSRTTTHCSGTESEGECLDGEWYDVTHTTVLNYPCQTSIDADDTDEFAAANSAISGFISGSGTFRLDSYTLVDKMEKKYATMDTDYGGLNPATYTWTDSRGDHSITAEVGEYKLARTVSTEHKTGILKKEYCLHLRDYSDSGSKCWVKVTRKDPANKQLGILGKWNPTASADERFFTITRTSKAAYSYDYIKMSGK